MQGLSPPESCTPGGSTLGDSWPREGGSEQGSRGQGGTAREGAQESPSPGLSFPTWVWLSAWQTVTTVTTGRKCRLRLGLGEQGCPSPRGHQSLNDLR